VTGPETPDSGPVFRVLEDPTVSSVQALKLEDPEGSVLLVTRIDDVVYTFNLSPALDESGNVLPFRMFDDNRQQLRDFLRALT
jgi:hypothetical protein